ncbi:hypothetical protein [Prescottella agglutinans]|uniref:Uncharacterized protein n=1 Tax=Prescottella agglutinans TaxID=1644129 RepID=A0ABT6MJD0_9NOCA|nr:hypothetical protein [Prescottella agglutinans]MDH6283979.1 hypothetical protein [Prescottella agglutinans]
MRQPHAHRDHRHRPRHRFRGHRRRRVHGVPVTTAIAKRLRVIEIANALHYLLRGRPAAGTRPTWGAAHQRRFDTLNTTTDLPELQGYIDHDTVRTLRAGLEQIRTERWLRVSGRALPPRNVALLITLSRTVELAKRDITALTARL